MAIDIILVRHAVAKDRKAWAERGFPDSDRPLSRKGRQSFTLEALGLTLLVGRVDKILSSPYSRTLQTARILSEHLGAGRRPSRLKALVPGSRSEQVIRELSAYNKGVLVVVGHEPELTELADAFLSPHFKRSWKEIKKGGAVRLSFPGAVQAGQGRLRWYLKPKALRELGRSFADSLPESKKSDIIDFPAKKSTVA